MEFKFNNSAREEKINKLAEQQIKVIQNNLSKGVRVTEMYIDNEYASDVRDKLDKLLEGQKFSWEVVRKEPNPYTGRMQHFTGLKINGERYYKLRYYGE